ncbi:MAG: hypothetical protein DKM50_06965 [Candidatus Margulisiibacteriota bacterium]|nr:MAG: hypothetical protein A2X43_10920 [Candidatus Margulisbacteria bacterium GWD2_39_127]OGI03064.1 MAG: hypothetical protein A2X42_05045 [Candidatus Margulisbacteria bacterium GWF2_38_17]OGI11607.1 MAG: hypothetical protein A2X41_04120 [Candidatus Margulisbacteria bacterium GWE2_39_32]PZM79915.1 MAG: hypothetical protein DKM50_06965 [Candidatus Margulisiibacteriota bacterium]HAR62833.1 hypothetical protein [Candidatus Margulisiibacteriota bacterium]
MNNKGFTVVELLLVCSIIAMLTMVMIPNIKNVRNKSNEMALKSNVFRLQTLLESYYLDNGHYLPDKATGAGLFEVFQEAGYITKIPKNPFTGQQFSIADSEGKITYTVEAENYTLTAYKSDGTTILVQADGG